MQNERYSCSTLTQTESCQQAFSGITSLKTNENSFSVPRIVQKDGRTEVAKLIGALMQLLVAMCQLKYCMSLCNCSFVGQRLVMRTVCHLSL